MGTPWRSRGFRDSSYGNLDDAGGLEDHIAGIKRLAQRVGIYGHSGGGYASVRALLVGKLLLAHGDLDDNVHPTGTLQLVDALVAANKDFDLLTLPNRNHLLVDLSKGKAASQHMDRYFLRRRI